MAVNNRTVDASVAALYLNNVRISLITGITISFQNELREVVGTTTVNEYIYGRDSWGVSADGFCTFQNGYNLDYLLEMLDQYQALTIKIPSNAAGTDFYQGTVLIQSVEIQAGNTGEAIRMSLSFRGSGPLTRTFSEFPFSAVLSSTVDGAGCATAHPLTYYTNNLASYPFLAIGDTVFTDSACTTALSGSAGYIGIANKYGVAYQINGSGQITGEELSTCTGGQTE